MSIVHLVLQRSTRFQKSQLLMLLAIILSLLQAIPALGAPEATPVIDPAVAPVGSITLLGWDGVGPVSFVAVDVNGDLLESSEFSADYYESPQLVTTPGSMASIDIFMSGASTSIPASATAEADGSLHFEVDVTPSTTVSLAGVSSLDGQVSAEINHTISLVGNLNAPLVGHKVSIVGSDLSLRTDSFGNASFMLAPGEYGVSIEPYGMYPGRDLTISVSEENPGTVVALPRLNAGNLTVQLSASLMESTFIRVYNGDGIMIAEAYVGTVVEHRFVGIAKGDGYSIVIEGTTTYQRTVHGPFSLNGRSHLENVKLIKRSFGDLVFIFTTADGSARPVKADIEISSSDWRASAVANQLDVNGQLYAIVSYPRGDYQFDIRADGFDPISGSGQHSSPNTQVRLSLVPQVVPTPTATAIPSPTPTVVPSPTATVVPPPTATAIPSPVPTMIPSPTPTIVPSPTPTMVPSPIPTMVPSPTPTVVPSPTPIVAPSPTPTVELTPTAEPLPGDTNHDGVITTTIVINTGDLRSLEGAPYDLFAPTASRAAIQPYRSGFVGEGNTIRLDDLPAGRYRLVVRADGYEPFDVMVDSNANDAVLSLNIATRSGQHLPSTNAPSLGGSSGEGVTDGTAGALRVEGTSEPYAIVTKLPETGTGRVSEPQGIFLIAVAAGVGMLAVRLASTCAADNRRS